MLVHEGTDSVVVAEFRAELASLCLTRRVGLFLDRICGHPDGELLDGEVDSTHSRLLRNRRLGNHVRLGFQLEIPCGAECVLFNAFTGTEYQ